MRKILLLFSVLFTVAFAANAQTRTVTGTVKDESGPLVGVTIQVKGSAAAAATDANGKYSIKVTDLQNVVIGAKYLGYVYQEVTLKPGETVLDFKLIVASNSLNEIVITGYGQQTKLTQTGAISTIDLKKVEDIPALSLTSALRGTVPGLSISGGSQRPGQGTTLLVRNPISLSKDGQGPSPLFIIDDIIRTQADFDALDINEVEAVSVLKDAEASIYGVLGANGVLIVRTKRGKSGAPKFSFSTSVGANNATQLPKMLSGYDLGVFDNDYNQLTASQQTTASWANPFLGPGVPVPNFYDANGFLHTGQVGPLGAPNSTTAAIATTRLPAWYTPDELAYFQANNNNYVKQAFNTAYIERTALNITGGNDKTTFFIGGDYVNQNSNFSGVNSYKYGLRANVDTKPAKGLDIFLSLSDDITYTKSYWYKLKSTSENLNNDFASLENIQPWQKYFIDGNIVSLGTLLTGGVENINFFALQNTNNFTSGTNNVMNMLGKITYEIPGVKGLSATFTMNKNINSANNKQFGTTMSYYKYAGLGDNNHIPGGALLSITPVDNGNQVRLNPIFADSYQLDAGLNYSRTFGKNSITALFLYEQREQNSDGVAAEADGVVNGGLPYQTFTTGAQVSSESASSLGFLSYISRINYAYDNKYLLQLVFREDGSARFSPGNQWGGFPAASVGWVASQESFMKTKAPWVDLLKFRVSTGSTGTDNTKLFLYSYSYNLGTGGSGGAVFNEAVRSTAVKPNVTNPNPNYTWDHVFKVDAGVDMAFLKNRLTFSGDYFHSHGYDLLSSLTSSVPATIGTAAPTENFAIVNGFGVELQLGWRDRVGKDFTYSFTPFFAWQDVKNIKIDVGAGDVGTERDLTGQSNDVGTYGLKSEGIIRTQADANAIIAERAAAAGGASKVLIYGQPLQPGMLNYQDRNGDGIIDDNDQQYLNKKSSNNKSLGLNWSVGYKGLSLNVVMGASWGGVASITGLKPALQSSANTGASIYDNRPSYWADHWTPDNTNARFPAPAFQAEWNNKPTDFWLVSATTINITSATLNFALPAAVTSKVGIASARFYLTGTNLYSFLNPFPDGYRDQQSDVYVYPTLRTISLGLNVGF